MRRNVSGQIVGAQMVSAADGSAFTGSVTCSVTLDGGPQATGSVGSGACTHEGNGYHTYAPSQGETNGALAAYTFTGTGAVPATVQVYTRQYDSSGYASWNPSWDAEVQSECTDALNAYDPPTNSEFEARTLASASYATASAQATAQADLDTLTGSDGVTLATSQPNYAPATQSSVDGLPTASENATAVWESETRVLTAGTNIALAKGTGVTGFNDLSAAQVNAEVDTAISDAALATAANLATLDGNVDDVKAKTDQLTFTETGVVDSRVTWVSETELAAAGTGGQGYGAAP